MHKTICIDFDGVLHAFTSCWRGPSNIEDETVPGAMQWLANLLENGYKPVIFSARRSSSFGGRNAMKAWIFDRMYDECYKIPPGTPMHDWRWRVINGYISTEPFDVQVFKAAKLFIKCLQFPKRLPVCSLAVSTRAIAFQGQFPTLEEIKNFTVWNG